MVRITRQRLLVIGDSPARTLETAVGAAVPSAAVTSVPSVFDAIAELNAGVFTGLLVPMDQIDRRPDAAAAALREAAGDARIVLHTPPAQEPLGKRLLEAGCDDYVISPVLPDELAAALAPEPLSAPATARNGRITAAGTLNRTGDAPLDTPAPGQPSGGSSDDRPNGDTPPGFNSDPAGDRSPDDDLSLIDGEISAPSDDSSHDQNAAKVTPDPLAPLLTLPLADLLLDALMQSPQQALKAGVAAIAERIAPTLRLSLQSAQATVDGAGPGRVVLSHVVSHAASPVARLLLDAPDTADPAAARHLLAQITALCGKAAAIDDRHARLQKLAITDDLTGVYNARYFKHSLARMCEKAKAKRFPVTLLLFDLDNFKRYNDLFGHGVGDEILKQTAALMKRCCRDHDLVARISGDEFAVVFWEKEGPRQPREPAGAPPARLPQTPLAIADRFRKLLHGKAMEELNALGPGGKGVLTVSGGMAVFPYDARTPEELIQAADQALMFGAKKAGKNNIYLVGDEADGSETDGSESDGGGVAGDGVDGDGATDDSSDMAGHRPSDRDQTDHDPGDNHRAV